MSVQAGDTFTPFVEGPLTVTDFVRYQGASGDMNPIHHDSEFAKAAGYARPFGPGMRQAGVLGGYVAGWLGADRIRRFRVQFREQVWPGDVVTYSVTVVDVREENGERFADLELACTRQTGGVHLRGWASFVVG